MATSILSEQRPCVKCGAQNRDKSGNCKSCHKAYRDANKVKAKEYQREYYARNREHLLAEAARHLADNRDEINKRERERYRKADHWREKSPDKYLAWLSGYLANNREARRIYEHNRRARKRQAAGKISPGLSDRLFALQKGLCPCCKRPLGKDYHMDHIIPLAIGGSNEDSNMQLLRATCNLAKSAKDPINFMQSRGYLL